MTRHQDALKDQGRSDRPEAAPPADQLIKFVECMYRPDLFRSTAMIKRSLVGITTVRYVFRLPRTGCRLPDRIQYLHSEHHKTSRPIAALAG
jgi:hypothetical protein